MFGHNKGRGREVKVAKGCGGKAKEISSWYGGRWNRLREDVKNDRIILHRVVNKVLLIKCLLPMIYSGQRRCCCLSSRWENCGRTVRFRFNGRRVAAPIATRMFLLLLKMLAARSLMPVYNFMLPFRIMFHFVNFPSIYPCPNKI